MRIAFFDSHRYERNAFEKANASLAHELSFFEPRLKAETVPLAAGFDAICAFVNDRLDAETLRGLHEQGVRLIALRCAGFNQVDLAVAAELDLPVVRVPEYSPYAVAEHAVSLILALNRKSHRSFNRVREANFSLEGLVGFDLHGKTIGIVGTGKIGAVLAQIMAGFGCRLLAYDIRRSEALQAKVAIEYVDLATIYRDCDIISLHAPLTPATYHMIDAAAFAQMKQGMMLINTSRGGLIDTRALVDALKTGRVGAAGLDVYEEEAGVFFRDLSGQILQDDVLARLLSFPNVFVTSHQAFLTVEALANIAETTLGNVTAFELGEPLVNQVQIPRV